MVYAQITWIFVCSIFLAFFVAWGIGTCGSALVLCFSVSGSSSLIHPEYSSMLLFVQQLFSFYVITTFEVLYERLLGNIVNKGVLACIVTSVG